MSDTTKLPYLKHHKENKRQILKGTGEWLLRDSVYRTWKDDSALSLLWLHGIPGSGKSKLTSLVIEDALQMSAQNLIPRPAIFYCSQNAAEPLRSDPASILTSIARQLANVNPEIESALPPPVVEMFEEKEAEGFASGALDIDDAVELIQKLVHMVPVTTIIIDALDECCAKERRVLLDTIKVLIEESSSLVRIFTSSREDGDIVFNLDRFPNMRISSAKNYSDIKAFLASEASRLVRSGYLLRNSDRKEEILGEITSRVTSEARGMFRWASLQLQNLTEMKTDADILNRLGKNPPTLQELYMEIYNRISTNQATASQTIARSTFSILLGLRQRVKYDEFLKLVQLDDEDVSTSKLLDICLNLVVLDVTARVFRFAHLSVQEFLEGLPDFSLPDRNMAISLCCLRQIVAWEKAKVAVWRWNLGNLGIYINKFLCYHLQQSGKRNRLLAMPQGLQTLLNQPYLSTFEGLLLVNRSSHDRRQTSGKIPKPPSHIESPMICLFNSFVLQFPEIVGYLMDRLLTGETADEERETHLDQDADDYVAERPLYRCEVTDATTFHLALAMHAIDSQRTSIFADLLEKDWYSPADLKALAIRTVASPFVEDKKYMVMVLNRHGLACISNDTIRELLKVALRSPPERASLQVAMVEELLARGWTFRMDSDFLPSLFSTSQGAENRDFNERIPVFNAHRVIDSLLLLIETNADCRISFDFIQLAIQKLCLTKHHVLRLLARCELECLEQKELHRIVLYCNNWEQLDSSFERGKASSVLDLAVNIIERWENGDGMADDKQSNICCTMGTAVPSQSFPEALLASSTDCRTIERLVSIGIEVTEQAMISACATVTPGRWYENESLQTLVYAGPTSQQVHTQRVLEKAVEYGQWSGMIALVRRNNSLVFTDELVQQIIGRGLDQWKGAFHSRLDTLRFVQSRVYSDSSLRLIDEAFREQKVMQEKFLAELSRLEQQQRAQSRDRQSSR